ncbi:MAG: Heavy metal translocating P-type ATPase, partial [uncultured bacterium]
MTEQYIADIGGMHCAACSSRIERVVGNMEGVAQCAVNLSTEQARIRYDADRISVQAIEEAIAGLGFTARAASPESDAEDQFEQSARQLLAMKRRLLPVFVLAILVTSFSMAHMVGIVLPDGVRPDASPLTYAVIQFLLTLPVLYLGRNFYLIGIPALLRGGPNMDSLIAIGTGAAFIYSTWNMVEIGLGHNVVAHAHDLYFESAAMLIAMISLGKYFEARSKARTTDAIRHLIQLAPETATLIEGGAQRQVAVRDIRVGDRILVRPGERVAV